MSGDIQRIEHVWIPMPDGVRLAARIWRPAARGSYPALLEYIPYRRRDLVRARDEQNHPYFAEHGYVCLRVDMRGSGDSEGSMADMYSDDELADARHVIDWIATQPWCDGGVGMFGTSWGGTASLQAAVNAPPALKAVLANCATIDRFDDDIHWMGGCLLTDSIEWGATLPAILAAPPDAATVGDGWWQQWQRRLESLTFPLRQWIEHSARGDYWRHGSVRFSAQSLNCPILAIGGWSDRYSNTVMPLVTLRPDLCWGIVGPWGHHYPDQGEPGPAIGFQQVALQWWDYWLKDSGQHVRQWPRLRLWRRQFDDPVDRLSRRNGSWIELDDPAQTPTTSLHIVDAGLSRQTAGDSSANAAGIELPAAVQHGIASGDTGYFGRVGGLPLDQAADDELALCYDAQPCDAALDIVGSVTVELDLSSARADGQLVARLCDVAPDGRSHLICRGVINLALDDTLDNTLPHDQPYARRIKLQLPTTAYRVKKGHTLRLALAASYWPLVWPALRSSATFVHGGSAHIPREPTGARPLGDAFPEATDLPREKHWRRRSDGPLQRECRQLSDGTVVFNWHQPATTTEFTTTQSAITTQTSARYQISVGCAATPNCRVDHRLQISRPDGTAVLQSHAELTDTACGGHMSGSLTVKWNGVELFCKRWGDE